MGSLDERQALQVTQGALLWCLRMWVLELKQGIDAEPQIDYMLDLLGVPTASPHLRDFVLTLSQSCTRIIDVRCVCQPQLSSDERTLLDVLSLAQSLQINEAGMLLRSFATAAGTDVALRDAESIGTALVQAGRFLPALEAWSLRNDGSVPLDGPVATHATIH